MSYNSRQSNVAHEMSDMVLPDKISAINWIKETHTWLNNNDYICQILAIERLLDQKVIGLIGIAAKEKLNGEVEILFGIADEFQNNGYATEAGKAIINWTFSNYKLNYIVAIIKPTNHVSQKVIKKLGFKFIEKRELDYEGKSTIFNYYRIYCPKLSIS